MIPSTLVPPVIIALVWSSLCVGLQNKRALLPGKGVPTLSQLLQEAKSRPEVGSEASVTDIQTPLSYSRLFDEYHGVVHLEALELLSKECDTKVFSCYGRRMTSIPSIL